MNVYLDNASTTQIDPDVLEFMKPYLYEFKGNPSSIHSYGRQAKVIIEESRRKISTLLNTKPQEIFFTSGGTESNNWILKQAIDSLSITEIITTQIEHKSILSTLTYLKKRYKINISYLEVDRKGNINLNQLKDFLSSKSNVLVSIMHANNEIGNINDIHRIGKICREFSAIFHSDTAQTMGHYKFNLNNNIIDSCIGTAHKFHGPRGIGFLYLKENIKISPLIHGGNQELGMRCGTENVAGIVGLGKALELAYTNFEKDKLYILKLKNRIIEKLKIKIPNIRFNGYSDDPEKSLYTILNISLPTNKPLEMILFKLDINGIAVSSGSACTSGSLTTSYVINTLGENINRANIRISFSKYNTLKDIDYIVDNLSSIINDNNL